MTLPTLTQGNTIKGEKIHVYLTETGSAPADYKATTVSTMLGSAIHLLKVESGFTLEEAEGDSILTTIGEKIVLTKNLTATLNALGLTPSDYDELTIGTNKLIQTNVDFHFVLAPADRTTGTVIAGDELASTYAVLLNISLSMADGQPVKVVLSFERTDTATTQSIEWKTILADA